MNCRLICLWSVLVLMFSINEEVNAADPLDKSWDFTGGSALGWGNTNHLTSVGVSGGAWHGTTSGIDPFVHSPDNLNLPASVKQYLVLRMRQKRSSGVIDRFAYSSAQIYFITTSSPTYGEDKRLNFTVDGNNRWRDIVIHAGAHASWTGTIRQIRLDPCSMTGAYVEVARIEILRDETPPEFVLEHEWNFKDSAAVRDTSPTLRLFGVFDNATGLSKAEFFYQPVTGGVPGSWVQDGLTDKSVQDNCEIPVTGFERVWNLRSGSQNIRAATNYSQSGSQSVGAVNGATQSVVYMDEGYLGLPGHEIFEGWFYDTGVTDGERTTGIPGRVGAIGCNMSDGWTHRHLAVVIKGDMTTGRYIVDALEADHATHVQLLTGALRSVGWHQVRFQQVSSTQVQISLDGGLLGTVNDGFMFKSFLWDAVDEGGSNTNGTAPDIYFDSFKWTDTNRSVDTTQEDGFTHTYDSLAPGLYNFSAKLYDKAGNVSWMETDDRLLSNVEINPSAPTLINVDSYAIQGPVTPEILGNNYTWNQMSPIVDGSGNLPAGLQARVNEMGLPMLRFPGGCFSDTFYWKLSIGLVANRPDQYINGCNTTLTNAGPAKYGLDEFLRYCENNNIVPLHTVRYRSSLDTSTEYNTALQEAADLVEYCLSPVGANINGGTDYAALRAANGHPAPYNIRHFELGNEPWGPDPYGNILRFVNDPPYNTNPATVAERSRNWARSYMMDYYLYQEAMKAIDPDIILSAAGIASNQEGMGIGERDEVAWDQVIFELGGPYIDAVHSHPYYPYSGWQTDTTELYWETISTARQLETMLQNRRRMIRQYAPTRTGELQMLLSEHDINYSWNGTYPMYSHTRTLKAAVAMADVFLSYLKNFDVIQSTHYWHLYGSAYHGAVNAAGSNYWRMGVFHTFRIFNHHFGTQLVDAEVIAPETYDYMRYAGSVLPQQSGVSLLSVAASRHDTPETLDLIVINRHISDAKSAQVNLFNFASSGNVVAEIWELNGPGSDAYNTSSAENVTITESTSTYPLQFNYSFPAHSVTSMRFTTNNPVPTPTPQPTVTPTVSAAAGGWMKYY